MSYSTPINKIMNFSIKLYEKGYTILPSLISEDTCDKLKTYLDNRFNEDLPFNYFKGHYQIHLPKDANNFPEEIVFNQKIHSILNDVFGSNYYMYSYTCNANLADEHQSYHMDCNHFHPTNSIKKFGSPGPPFQIIVNVYLQDTNENNGSFDIISRSHRFTDFKIDDEGRISEKYVPKENSFRCNLPKGSVIIRDKRTWHRGTKNDSGKVRYMVGCSFSAGWYKLNDLVFEEDCEDCFYDAPFSTWNIKYST